MRAAWIMVFVGSSCTPHDFPQGPAPSGDPAVATDAGRRNVFTLSPVSHRALTAYPTLQTTCERDSDCDLVGALRSEGTLRGCCLQCGVYIAGNRTWARDAVGACLASGPCSVPQNCPEPTVRPYTSVCASGQCVLRPTPTVWRTTGDH